MANTRKEKRTILVTGATGRQGGAALRHLRDRGFPVRAVTRDPDQPKARGLMGRGVEVVRADMEDQGRLIRVLEGVYGVHSVQNPHQAGIDAEIRQGTNLADAAKRSDVTYIVYSSVAAAEQQTGIPHFESKFRIEEHIRGTGLHFTFIRPVFFMENWLGMRQAIESGTISLPLDPTTRLQMIAVDDIGGMVAAAFEHTGKWQDSAIELAGAELSMTELAEAFSRITGREVRYVQVPWEEFQNKAGHEVTVMYRWFQQTGYHVDIGAARQQYPKLTSFEQWIHSYWNVATKTAG
jgi:uncharacterized protein YbjT (DUF2867 family)